MFFTSNWWNRFRYRLWAPLYDRLVARMASYRRRSLQLADIQPGERVLLLGAGTGLDLLYLPHGCQVTAIDITPAMLERLRSRAQNLGLAVEILVMDGQDLNFEAAYFDVVVLHLILAVIPDPFRCIAEAARVLKPDGRAVIFDKFLPTGRVPLFVHLLQPLASVLGTELNRRLEPFLKAVGWEAVVNEPAMLGGFFRIVLARRPG